MKLITATRLKQLGADVWPVNGPIFYDRFSHADLELARKLESRRFTTEADATKWLGEQPWPRFVLDAPTNEETVRAQAIYAQLLPENEFVLRYSSGPMALPGPPPSSEY